MKELMQKALAALNQHKGVAAGLEQRGSGRKPSDARRSEDWGMSPEDALRVGTVARYK